MSDSLLIANTEMRQVLRSRMKTAAIAVIILLPLIYGFLYLWAFWDPYGNLEGLPVAIVNLDRGGYRDGEFYNAGEELLDRVIDSGNVSWHAGSYSEAVAGLDSKRYYAMLVIPENFTEDILSVEDAEPHNAMIYFRARDANNYLGSRISKEVAKEIEREANENITGQYIDKALPIKDSLVANLSDGSEGADELSDGLHLIEKGASKLNNGAEQLYSGSKELSEGLSLAADGSESLAESSKSLYKASSSVSKGISDFRIVLVQLNNKGYIDDATLAAYIRLDAGMQQVAEGQDRLADGAESLSDNMGLLEDGAEELSDGLKQASEGTDSLRTGLMMVYDGSDELSVKLGEKTNDLKSNLSDERVRDAVMMIRQPVEVEDVSEVSFPNYGTALSPYFVQLGLWVGGLVLLLVVIPKDNRLTVSRFSTFSITIGKSILPMIIGALQAIVLDFTLIFVLGLEVANLPLFVAFTILLSWTFIAIIQFFIFVFGKAGEIPAIVMLMLQLTSAGGTFPIETSHRFFQVVGKFLPMSYGMSALREILLGGNIGIALDMAVVILFFLVVFFVLRMLATRRKLKATDVFPLLDI